MLTIPTFYKILLSRYGYLGWWPVYSNRSKQGFTKHGYRLKPPYYPIPNIEIDQIIIGAVLTQNTAWKNVEHAFAVLEKNNCLSRKSVCSSEVSALSTWIYSSGCYNQKARKLKSIFNKLPQYTVPERATLLNIWGVGPETADSILLYAYGVPCFIADTYARRIFGRLQIIPETVSMTGKYDEIADIVEKQIKFSVMEFQNLHAVLIEFGKEFCKKVPQCCNCPIREYCSYTSN